MAHGAKNFANRNSVPALRQLRGVGRAATAGLGEILRCCPALYADREKRTTGCAVVPERFAALADAMAEFGDTTGLDIYG